MRAIGEDGEARRAIKLCICICLRSVHKNHGALQILFEETLFQDSSDGTPLVEVLQRQGIVPGARFITFSHTGH